MRYLAFTLVLCATGLLPVGAFGNGMVAVATPSQTKSFLGRPYAAPASGGVESRPGLLHRFHGKSPCSCQSSSPVGETRFAATAAAAAPATGAMFSDPTRPCFNQGTFAVDAKGMVTAGPGHCFPNCFTGTPCTCCDHHVKYLNPNSPRGRAYAWMAQGYMPPSAPPGHVMPQGTPIQYPGLMSRILRRNP